ncbi:MAG: hypothetical protein ACTSQP_05370 [Promethearchaeota archaeon]
MNIDLSLILGISLILWILGIIIGIVIVVFSLIKILLKKYSKEFEESRFARVNIYTWIIFLMLIACANILTTIIQFYTSNQAISGILERISIVLIYTAIFAKVIYIENSLNRLEYYRGHYFTIISIITILVFIFVDPEFLKKISPLQIILIFLIFIDYSLMPVLYFYLALKTTGQSRKDALKISAGSVFIGLGLLFRPLNLQGYYGITQLLDALINYTNITAPISIIIGFILIFNGFRGK